MSENIDRQSQIPGPERPLTLPEGISPGKIAEKLPHPETISDIWTPKNTGTLMIQDSCYKIGGIDKDTAKNGVWGNVSKAFLDGYILSKIDTIEGLKNLSSESIGPALASIMDSIKGMLDFSSLSDIARQASVGGEILMKKISDIAGMPITGLRDILEAILKYPYRVTRFIAEQIPLPPGVSLALTPLISVGKTARNAMEGAKVIHPLKGLRDIAKRDEYLSELLKKPFANASQLLNDMRTGVIGHSGSDFESKLVHFLSQSPQELGKFVEEGVRRISLMGDPIKKQAAISEFEPWKKLALGVQAAEKRNVQLSSSNRIENTVRTGMIQ